MLPRYLRVIVTPRCSLRCTYCHMEGDPGVGAGSSRELIIKAAHAAHAIGVRKIKFLGGEPLLRRDLPTIVEALAGLDGVDLSLITGGAASTSRLDACFDAGLHRANMSIHGWSLEAFSARAWRGRRAWRMRNHTLDRLLDHGRPLKLNYVYTGRSDEGDLGQFLDHCAGLPVVINVLDDLGNPTLDHRLLRKRLVAMRGPYAMARVEPDPHSLPTLHLEWPDGLVVELKHHQLGALAPWHACHGCPVWDRCREGIHALRLGHDGRLRTCMDRDDIGVSLAALLADGGDQALRAGVACFVHGQVRRRA